MLLAGALSTMNMWANRIEDIRLSLNDGYMILLMSGWMLLFMGIYDKYLAGIGVGVILVVASLWCIRTQAFISESQFLRGMIPHHSMAVFMSRKLLEKETRLTKFLQSIIETQDQEIAFMKQLL
jgi:hypothetical protein